MRTTERQLRKIIREALLAELEGAAADDWEAAHLEADKILAQRKPAPVEITQQQDILDRIDRGIDTLIGPELRMLDRLLTKLGL